MAVTVQDDLGLGLHSTSPEAVARAAANRAVMVSSVSSPRPRSSQFVIVPQSVSTSSNGYPVLRLERRKRFTRRFTRSQVAALLAHYTSLMLTPSWLRVEPELQG